MENDFMIFFLKTRPRAGHSDPPNLKTISFLEEEAELG